MDILILGLCIFFVMHLLPSFTSQYAALKNKLGGKIFKVIFVLISFTGLWLIIFGMGEVEFSPLYEPPSWGKHVTSLLMLIALYCLISSETKTSIRKITAHPMLWGISAWAAGHLLANGDKASVMLFGSFLTYSLFAMYSANQRGARPTGESLALKTDIIVLLAAALVCIGLMFFHDAFTGMPIMG